MGGLSVVKLQSDHQNQVTSVICRNIKPGHEKDYDNWARRYLTFERKAPGYFNCYYNNYSEVANDLYGILFAVLLINPLWKCGIIQKNHRSYYRKQKITLHDITRPPLVWKHALHYRA